MTGSPRERGADGRRRRARRAGLALVAAAFALPGTAAAFDYSWSAFGTVGYARSNQPYTYERFIDDDGTFRRDSVVGLQVDARLNNEFGATVQVKGATASDDDHRYKASTSWAFASYRPTNDLLVRLGKQRIPIYLYSESYDVGATYEFARLPQEMYSLAPSNDFKGASVDKTWRVGDDELLLTGYYGVSDNDFRIWQRDGLPGVLPQGATFTRLQNRGGGLVLAYRSDRTTLRASVVRITTRPRGSVSLPADYPFVSIAPGLGYYQTSDQLPGPGPRTVQRIPSTTFIVGADVSLPYDLRVIAEGAREIVRETPYAPRGNRGYVSLLRPWGRWTPYVVYSSAKSPASEIAAYTAVDQNRLPPFVPGSAAIDAAQRAGADGIVAYDQRSWAFGTSYAFSPTSKLKAEFLRTHVGAVSQFVDAPTGQDVRYAAINVWSLSYSVVFQ